MMNATQVEPKPNLLLAALPPEDRAWFAEHLESVQLEVGEMLYEPGQPQPWVYFPDGAIISMLYVMESGASGEVAIVGNSGLLGVSLLMGVDTPRNHAMVLSAGPARRMKGETLRRAFEKSGELRQLLLRHT